MGIRLKSTSFTEYFNESACLDMFRSFLRDKVLLSFLLLAILLKIFSTNEYRVEHYYTHGLYPIISKSLRFLLGWIPFSIGDLLYLLAFLYLIVKTYKFLVVLKNRKVAEYLSWVLLKKLLRLVLGIYLIGQFLEANILYPKLVGQSININPVWLMFALFAFALLFGFVGLLLAVPLAAISGVLTRFAIQKYQASSLYLGTDDGLVLTAAPVGGPVDGVTLVATDTAASATVAKPTPPRRRRSPAK